MKFLSKSKDGGPESTVHAYWLIEIKSLFSVVLLRFDGKSREAFHTHAFNAVSWLLWGQLTETMKGSNGAWFYYPSFRPIFTGRDTFHKVDSIGTSWALSFRGPWNRTWKEFIPYEDRERTLASGRIDVE